MSFSGKDLATAAAALFPLKFVGVNLLFICRDRAFVFRPGIRGNCFILIL